MRKDNILENVAHRCRFTAVINYSTSKKSSDSDKNNSWKELLDAVIKKNYTLPLKLQCLTFLSCFLLSVVVKQANEKQLGFCACKKAQNIFH